MHAAGAPGLAAGQVEGDDALVAEAHRRLGDAERHLGGVVPERAVDHPGHDAEVPLAAGQAAQLGGDRLVEREAALGAQVGAVAHLEVAEIVARRILAHLVRHPLDGLGRLQHRDGGVELLQELLEVMRVIHQHELPDDVGIGRGQRRPGGAGELDQRFGAERAIEVDVEFGLGQAARSAHA